MSIQYMVLGFKPITFSVRVSSHNHWARVPAQFFLICLCYFLDKPALP